MSVDVLGPLCSFLASVTWVTGSSAYTHLSKSYVPAAINFNRALVALPLFVGFAFFDRANAASSMALLPAAAGWLSLSMAASYVLGDALFMYATRSLGFSSTQAVTATYPIWATLAAVLFAGEVVTARGVFGLLLAITGVVVVVMSTKAPAGTGKKSIGVLLAFIASLAWGVNSFAVARGGHGVHFAVGNAVRMSVAVLLCPVAARVQSSGGVFQLVFSRADYQRFLPVIAFEAFVGSAVYLYGLSHCPMAIGATLSSLAPVLSVPVAVAIGWEQFSWMKSAGVAVVMGGLALLLLQ